MRLTYEQSHSHLDAIYGAVQGIKEEAEYMRCEAMRHHLHGNGWDEPQWLDAVGQALDDSACEAMAEAEALERFLDASFDYVERKGEGIAVRSIRAAYRRLMMVEALL